MSSTLPRQPAVTATLMSLFLVAFSIREARSEAYYLSSSTGNDADSGTSATSPWATFRHLRPRLADNDTVLLRRGDIFRDSMSWPGSSTIDLSFMAYGDPGLPKPVISGSIAITGWTRHSGNIWKAPIPDAVNHLYFQNRLMLHARYPNQGWLRIRTFSDNRIEAPQLLDHPRNADGYFDGATVRMRPFTYWHDIETASSYRASDGSFRITTPSNTSLSGWAFYFDNMLSELDTAGEWYHDKTADLAYLWVPGGADPNTMLVEGSVLEYGLKAQVNLVRDICFRHQTDRGLSFWGNEPIVERCRFEGIERVAAFVSWSTNGGSLRNSVFADNLGLGINVIQGGGGRGITIEYDTLYRTGTVPAYEKIQPNVNIQSSGILVYKGGTGIRVTHCLIEETGYAGIQFNCDNNTADHNVIRYAMSRLIDGGAIYTYGNRNTIKHNIISGTGVLDDGCHASWDNLHQGIWPEFLGDFRGMIVDSNTVYGSIGRGLLYVNLFDGRVRGNTFFDNQGAQATFGGKERNLGTPQGNVIANNIFYANSRFRESISFNKDYDYGALNDNYFCCPYKDLHIRCGGSSLTISKWQEQYTWADPTARTDFAMFADDSTLGEAQLFVNDQEQTKVIPLSSEYPWRDLDGNPVSGSITLEPFTSRILIPMNGNLAVAPRGVGRTGLGQLAVARSGRLTTLRYSLSAPATVTARILNAGGRELRRIIAGKLAAGDHQLVWDGMTVDGTPVATGLFLISLTTRSSGGETHRTVPVVLHQ